jgi:hypothetical protein
MATPIPNDWIAEEEIAKSLGVEREKIRAERPRLAAGEVGQQGRVIVWCRAAAMRLAAKLGLESPFPKKTPPPAARAVRGLLLEKNPPPGSPEVLTVFSTPRKDGWHFGQHNLIRAKRLNGEIVVVRVIDSRKYLPALRNGTPMTIVARPSDAGAWWWPVGREPRFPGVW